MLLPATRDRVLKEFASLPVEFSRDDWIQLHHHTSKDGITKTWRTSANDSLALYVSEEYLKVSGQEGTVGEAYLYSITEKTKQRLLEIKEVEERIAADAKKAEEHRRHRLEETKTIDGLIEACKTEFGEYFSKVAASAQKKTMQQQVIIDCLEIDRWSDLLGDTILAASTITDGILVYPRVSLDKFIDEVIYPVLRENEIYHKNVIFVNLPDSRKYRISALATQQENSLVRIEGTLRHASERYSKLKSATFECVECGNEVRVEYCDDEYYEPKKCICGKSTFRRVLSKDEKVDTMRLQIEEDMSDVDHQPQSIKCYLQPCLAEDNALVSKIYQNGAKVSIIGIVREMQKKTSRGKKSQDFSRWIEVFSIDFPEIELIEIAITPDDKKRIEKIARSDKVRDILRDMFAPHISGCEMIKDGILMQLLSSASQKINGRKQRKGIHVLLCGDPSTAKSELLVYVGTICQRYIYATGRGSSGVGLTASVVKADDGQWELIRGAIPCAHKGHVGLDELQLLGLKDDSDINALRECMEQQTISVFKAGIRAILKAETCILGAANPKNGRWNPYKSANDNIGLPDPIVSRFDLKYVLRDIPDSEKDAKLIHTVTKWYIPSEAVTDDEFVKKYIFYAKKNVPAVSIPKRICDKVEAKYVELRAASASARNTDKTEDTDFVPIAITPRDGKTILRLIEASARMRLSGVADDSDFSHAWNVFSDMVRGIGLDPETGTVDADKLSGGYSKSESDRMDTAFAFLKGMGQESKDGTIDREDCIKKMTDVGIFDSETRAAVYLDQLRIDKKIIEIENGRIKLTW